MGQRIEHIAGIVFALMFIAILALMNSNVIGIGNSVNDQLSRTYEATEMRELASFDDTKVTGSTVISAIKNYDNLYHYDMEIYVDGESYGAAAGARDYAYASTHIDPTASFSAALEANANGVTNAIWFTSTP